MPTNAMYRRVVSLLLLPCLLLARSAAVGHCHGEGQPAGHDLRPHFHVTPLTAALVHRHGPGDRHQHHDGTGAPGTASVAPGPTPDHDEDAVFLTADLAIASASLGGDARVSSALLLPTNPSPGWLNDRHERFALRPHPPPHAGPLECPLYVRHLALLI